ncbi:hypothetical protein S245_034864, partial [Arachis hypogaea]
DLKGESNTCQVTPCEKDNSIKRRINTMEIEATRFLIFGPANNQLRALFLALNADEHSQCELAFLSSLSVTSSVSNRSGVTLCDSISRLSIHSLSFLLMRYASA